MRHGMTPQDIAAYKCYLGELNRRVLASADRKNETAERAVAEKQEEVVRMNSDISALDHLKGQTACTITTLRSGKSRKPWWMNLSATPASERVHTLNLAV